MFNIYSKGKCFAEPTMKKKLSNISLLAIRQRLGDFSLFRYTMLLIYIFQEKIIVKPLQRIKGLELIQSFSNGRDP